MSVSESIKYHVGLRIARLDEDTPWARAMLAKLRRGAGKEPGEVPDILEITVGDLPEELTRDNGPSPAERAIHTALTLYSLHRQGKSDSMHSKAVEKDGKPKAGDSFGRATGRLIKPDKSNEAAIKRRFDAVVTAQDPVALSWHARSLVQLIRAADIPVKFDYERFAADLHDWCYPDSRDHVRLYWGRDFYRQWNEKETDSKQAGE
jgi:CRISPR system Cascade subunit CasB